MPPGHGTYRGLDLELLDPSDQDELSLLIEAQHTHLEDPLRGNEDMIASGEPFNPGCTPHCTRSSRVSCWPTTRPRHGRPFSGWPARATTGTTSCT